MLRNRTILAILFAKFLNQIVARKKIKTYI